MERTLEQTTRGHASPILKFSSNVSREVAMSDIDDDLEWPDVEERFNEFAPVRSDSAFAEVYDEIAARLRALLKNEPSYTILGADYQQTFGKDERSTPCILLGVRDPENVSVSDEDFGLACRTEAGPIMLLLYKDDDSTEEECESGLCSSEHAHPSIFQNLTSGQSTLNEGEKYHAEISLGNSIGPHPEWKKTSLSHGMFLEDNSGTIFSLSAGHGFPLAKKGSKVVSPALLDIRKATTVLAGKKKAFEAARDQSSAELLLDRNCPTEIGQLSIDTHALRLIERREQQAIDLAKEPDKAAFAEVVYAKKKAIPAVDLLLDPLSEIPEEFEHLDYCLCEVTDPGRATANRYLQGGIANLHVGELILDSEITLNSKHLGQTYGIVSGVCLYQKSEKRAEPEYRGKVLRSHFAMMNRELSLKNCVRLKNGGDMNKGGSSGAVWIQQRETRQYAVGLHRAGAKISAPARPVPHTLGDEYILGEKKVLRLPPELSQVPTIEQLLADFKNALDANGVISNEVFPQYQLNVMFGEPDDNRALATIIQIRDEEGKIQWDKIPKYPGEIYVHIAMMTSLPVVFKDLKNEGYNLRPLWVLPPHSPTPSS